MAYLRNVDWKEDQSLKNDLEKYVKEDLRRKELLDFLKRDYAQYTWSLSSLDRRMRYFDISYTDKNVTVEQVKEAVAKEIDGPGKLLGYRAMQKKLRQEHKLNVPRDLVYAAMQEVDPQGLEARGGVGNGRQKKKGKYTTKGPNFVHSLDGHDKLMGYQNRTFPLAIYGCIDTASRKILWLKIWVSNSNPQQIGRWYLEYLYETGVMPWYLRLDKGTETGTMATMHAYLHRMLGSEDPSNTIIYGPSTSNQVKVHSKLLQSLYTCLLGIVNICFSLVHILNQFDIIFLSTSTNQNSKLPVFRLNDGGGNSMKGWRSTLRST